MKSKIIIVGVFAGFMGLIALVAVGRARQLKEVKELPVIKPAVVRVSSLESQSFEMVESFYGLIEARATIDMSFQIAGRLKAVGPSEDQTLVEGDVVEEKQVIAMLEPLRYKAAVEGAKANEEVASAALEGARAKYAQAAANVAAVKAVHQDSLAKFEDAQIELKKMKDLLKAGAARQREVDTLEVALKVAQANVDRTAAQMNGAKAELDGARANVSSADASYRAAKAQTTVANVNLQDATLLAPRRATVAKINGEIGQMMQPGQQVVRLVDLNSVRLVVGVVESKIPLLKVGQHVEVDILALRAQAKVRSDPALRKVRTGKVVVVPPAADPQSGMFRVEIELDNKDGALLPGMVGKASVNVETRRGFSIPAEAVTRNGERLFAFFVKDGHPVGLDMGELGRDEVSVPMPVAVRVELTAQVSQKDRYLVSGVPQDLERLVVEGQSRLVDGQPVTVINAGLLDRTAAVKVSP